MKNFITDLNKMVNTIQKVDKLLTEKPKRKRIKRDKIDFHLYNLMEALSQKPKDELIGNLNYVIDNLNEMGIDYTITLKTI